MVYDSLKELYIKLLEQGWTMSEIDNMDILFYFELQKYRSSNEPTAYIDQVL